MITVNGQNEELLCDVSILTYLTQKNYPTTRIAVEKNGDIVPKSRYENTMITDGDKLEIVTFVGGG